MKWFKHENTFNNSKVEILEDREGLIGYAVYFKLLEMIMSPIEESNPQEWGYIPKNYTKKYIAKKINISEKKLEKILETCCELNLFCIKNERIFCEKVLDRADEYTKKILRYSKNEPKDKKSVHTNSGVSPEKIRLDKNKLEEDIEQNREEGEESAHTSKKTSLDEISEGEMQAIAETYQVPLSFVISKQDDLCNYVKKKGITYEDYNAALRDWVKRDAINLRKEVSSSGKSKLRIITPDPNWQSPG